MLKSFSGSTLSAIALLAASTASASVTQDTKDVPTLIAAYHQAVIGRNGARLA